jgi:hypothetical protein
VDSDEESSPERPTRQRTDATPATKRLQRRLLRQALEYQGERQISGTSFLEEPLTRREAHLWTLEDGEHLVLLVQDRRYCHWEPTREPLEVARHRAIQWLTEPPTEPSP